MAAAAEQSDDAGDLFASTVLDAEVTRLKDCMMRLNNAHRNAISLAFMSGLTHGEVAERLGAPLGPVKSWIRRGLENLKECLDR